MALIKKSLPKNRRVIKFHQAFKSLDPMDEHWENESFEEREKKIFDLFLEKTGFPPTKHLSYLRETSIPILEVTTMEQLKSLSCKIHEQFGLDCIQISIDRTKNHAHMLFDFIDREKMSSMDLNVSDYKYILALIYHHLDLYQYELPDDIVRHYLVTRYETEPSVFQKAIERIDNVGLGKRSYRIIRNSLQYMEQICKEIAMKRKCNQTKLAFS